jgi:hypothetical protein
MLLGEELSCINCGWRPRFQPETSVYAKMLGQRAA